MNINELFTLAVQNNASDLHIMVGMPPILRIDGELKPIFGKEKEKIDIKTAKELIFSILTEKQKNIFEGQKELDLSHELKNSSRFRVNLFWERGNPGLVARVIPKKIPTMKDIAMSKIVYEFLNVTHGLILVTGPTGCGKSTSLAAMIDHININRSVNIVTLEDPIEFIFKPQKSIIKQRQLHTDMESFQSALIHVLRQDPNVIMVGEMRDLETIATTITLAETGHLVLATLHTHNTAQTIDRIIDIFPPYQQQQIRLQLSMTLCGIISQRLLPKVSGGRVAAREILINTPAVANMVRENKIAQIRTALETSAEDGMMTMDQDITNLYKEGKLSKETARFHMINPELLK